MHMATMVRRPQGNKPSARVPNKAQYMDKDWQRMQEFMNVPLNEPANFVEAVLIKVSFTVMCFVMAVDMKHPDKTEALSRELWILSQYGYPCIFQAGEKAGLSEAVIKDAFGRIKDMLKQNPQNALDCKAFGVPTIIAHMECGPELIFGPDHFDILATLLGEEWKGPLPGMAASKLKFNPKLKI